MIIGSDLEWSAQGIDVLGVSWDEGTKCAATHRDEATLRQYFAILRQADLVVGQNYLDADCRQMVSEGIDVSWLEPKVYDIRLAMHCINGHLAGSGSFDLRSIVLLLGSRQGQRFLLEFKQYESNLHKTCALDSAAALWCYPTLQRQIAQYHLEPTLKIAHDCSAIFARMREQGVKLDTKVLEQIYTARKAKTEEVIERYHLWEERGKKVIKKVPIWRSDRILDICFDQFGIRPKDRQRATWTKLLGSNLVPEAREFVEAIIDLGKGANDSVWMGKIEETENGLDFGKIGPDGFIHPRYDICGSPDRAIASNPNCFDSQTEILTKRGWAFFSTLTPQDSVAQWSNGSISFVTPTQLWNYKYAGPMITVHNEHIDLRVTDDHRCLLQSKKNKLRVVPARDLANNLQCKQLNAGTYVGGLGLRLSTEALIILCALQADGTWGHSSRPSAFWNFRKTRKIERLTRALKKLGIAYKIKKFLKTTQIGDKNYNKVFVRISVGPCLLLDTLYGYLGKSKLFGAWILDLSHLQLESLATELPFWDGTAYATCSRYFSSIETNADWAQIIFALSNRRARKVMDYRSKLSNRPAFTIGVSSNNYSWLANARVYQETPAVETVYCVSVPSSFVVVRRNRDVMITGNCQNFPRPSDDPRPIKLRSAVIPIDESHVILGADFSSVETITNAFESKDMDRVRAVLNGTISHEGTAQMINDTFGLSLNRPQGKVCNHAFDKGESPFNLARRLFNTERPSRQQTLQCQNIFQRMLAEYPETAKFRDSLWDQAKSNPLTVTNSFGRRLMCFSRAKYGDMNDRFAKHVSAKKYWCSCAECSPRRDRWKYAIAFLGRSCAFDALLRVMAKIWYEKRLDAYSLPYLEIHDELDFSIPREKADLYTMRALEAFQEPFTELDGISLPASVKIGKSWLEAH